MHACVCDISEYNREKERETETGRQRAEGSLR